MRIPKSPFFIAGTTIAALALAAQAAFAAPQPPAPGPGPGPGHGGPGIVRLFDEVHTALLLTAAQEALWQQLKADEAALEIKLQVLRQDTGALVDVELAKPAPDLVAILGVFEDSRNAAQALLGTFEQEIVGFYSKLTAAQQALVVAAFKAHLQHAAGGRPGPR